MAFNSPLFIGFLLMVVLLHSILSPRYRLSFLVFASFVFIGYYNLESLYVLLFFTLFNFFIAKKISLYKYFYHAGLVANVAAILLFNYINASHSGYRFYLSEIAFDASAWIVTLGLSFYSLQNIAYLSDVYYGRTLPETSILKYMLFTSFFPKIMSGPIIHSRDFLPQVSGKTPSVNQLASGINYFLYGLFKKMVLADRLAPAVDAVFETTHNQGGMATLIGIYLFTIQLYFDFSGYTDMALGVSKMLGFELKDNFKMPFRSASVSEFWRRWHISLINWFTTYVYYPVVYSLRNYSKLAVWVGIGLTFIVSAIWHGIGLTFLLWATCHITYIYIEQILPKRNKTTILLKGVSVLFVFHAVVFSNIFFRAKSAERAFELIQNMFTGFWPVNWHAEVLAPLVGGGNPVDEFNAGIAVVLVVFILLFEKRVERHCKSDNFKLLLTVIMLLLIIVFGVYDSGQRFIYMQF